MAEPDEVQQLVMHVPRLLRISARPRRDRLHALAFPLRQNPRCKIGSGSDGMIARRLVYRDDGKHRQVTGEAPHMHEGRLADIPRTSVTFEPALAVLWRRASVA